MSRRGVRGLPVREAPAVLFGVAPRGSRRRAVRRCAPLCLPLPPAARAAGSQGHSRKHGGKIAFCIPLRIRASDIGTTFEKPVIYVAEARKENCHEGWAQALAEMIASQRFNQDENTEILGIVTTGIFWQFGKLQDKILTLEIVSYSALEKLQKLLHILHWMFYEPKQSVETIKSSSDLP